MSVEDRPLRPAELELLAIMPPKPTSSAAWFGTVYMPTTHESWLRGFFK